MRPAALIGSSPSYRIVHVCETCKTERINKLQAEDSTDAMVELARHPHAPSGSMLDVKTGAEYDPLKREESFPEATKGDIGHRE